MNGIYSHHFLHNPECVHELVTYSIIHYSTYVIVQEVKEEFRDHFRNITRLIDCVSCDKCKLWGKLQVSWPNFLVISVFFKTVQV